jgi:hypothetical protein
MPHAMNCLLADPESRSGRQVLKLSCYHARPASSSEARPADGAPSVWADCLPEHVLIGVGFRARRQPQGNGSEVAEAPDGLLGEGLPPKASRNAGRTPRSRGRPDTTTALWIRAECGQEYGVGMRPVLFRPARQPSRLHGASLSPRPECASTPHRCTGGGATGEDAEWGAGKCRWWSTTRNRVATSDCGSARLR